MNGQNKNQAETLENPALNPDGTNTYFQSLSTNLQGMVLERRQNIHNEDMLRSCVKNLNQDEH